MVEVIFNISDMIQSYSVQVVIFAVDTDKYSVLILIHLESCVVP